MKINIKYMKWVFLGLYLAILISLFGMINYGIGHEILVLFYGLKGNLIAIIQVLICTFASQILFIVFSGKLDIRKPMHPGRLLIPVVISAAMMAILFMAVTAAMLEVFDHPNSYGSDVNTMVLILLGINWLVWGVAFYLRYKKVNRQETMNGLVENIIKASLMSLLLTVPAHIYVSRRPGCFVGILTSVSVCLGIVIMLWSFGPGLILIFLSEVKKQKSKKKA